MGICEVGLAKFLKNFYIKYGFIDFLFSDRIMKRMGETQVVICRISFGGSFGRITMMMKRVL